LVSDRNHIIVFRFSALGDIAMVVPVVKQWLDQHPQLIVTVVSTSFAAPLFQSIPRCHFVGADLKGKHSGLFGLYRLYKEIRKQTGNALVADLHQVLRTAILKFFFRLSGHTIATIDKGRKEKRLLTSKKNKVKSVLKLQHERYADVFRALGFQGELDPNEKTLHPKYSVVDPNFSFSDGKINIGVAPFAKHLGKCYPTEKMKALLHLLKDEGYRIFLFGGGEKEIETLRLWVGDLGEDTFMVAGKYPFSTELEWIASMDLMVTMDSANMHLASLFSIPVVSIWGATHPDAGFMGFGQSKENAVSLELSCSPCSVFGNKPCWRGDYACMNQLEPRQIFLAISSCASKFRK